MREHTHTHTCSNGVTAVDVGKCPRSCGTTAANNHGIYSELNSGHVSTLSCEMAAPGLV